MRKVRLPAAFRRRRVQVHMLVIAAVGLALVVSACGSSSSKSASSAVSSASSAASSAVSSATSAGSSSASSAPAPTGSPIKTMTIADVNTQGPAYPNIPETAKLYEQWVNAHGGIAGHPLEVTTCDGQGTPTAAATCAHEAVADHDVAVVGSFTFTGNAIVPILAAGKTAYWGLCCALAPAEFTSPDAFQLGSDLYSVGAVVKANQDGCKKTSLVLIQGAESLEPLLNNAMKSFGKSFTKVIILPATSTDYSPQVAEATSGTDCIVTIFGETPFKAWMPAFAQSGGTQKMYGAQGNLDALVAKGFESQTNGDVIAGAFLDISLPQWADYRAAITQYHAPTNLTYNSLAGLGTWAGYLAFKQVVGSMKGPINNQTVLAAASKAKINLPGIVPPINYAKPWVGGPPGYQRVFNRGVGFQTLKNGQVVPLTTKFTDMSNPTVGKPCGCPMYP
jgi:branched-chain amino acid transport system substrate-binding protein